jgi:hypothetical protein
MVCLSRLILGWIGARVFGFMKEVSGLDLYWNYFQQRPFSSALPRQEASNFFVGLNHQNSI